MLKKTLITFALVFTYSLSFAYGPIGHRAIAKIAEEYLSWCAKRKIKKLLGDENLVLVATFADDIKSERAFDFAYTWHFINLNQGENYEESEKNPKGDLVTAFNHCVKTLKNKNASKEDKRFCLKFLVHILGDAHQPLHIGRPQDRGANDIKVQWFGKETNLHRVWDSDMLQFYKMSYSELAENMPKLRRKERKQWQEGSFVSWIEETHSTTDQVYGSAKEGEKLSYRYMYDHFDTLKLHLHKAGVRLAKVLNDIF